MSVLEVVLILLAGVWAGTINAVVGSGTLVTFPVLVAFGFNPVVASMTNSVGLVAGGVSGTWGYRRELQGQWTRLAWQIPGSLLGAITGSWLLLHLPENTFKKVVPVLLGIALILVVSQTRIQAWIRRRAEAQGRDHTVLSHGRLVVLFVSTYLAGVYGGYFAAAQGILLVGLMGVILPESMQRLNAAKNLLSLVVNVVAAAAYTLVAFHRINWAAAGLIAVGSLAGGFAGAGIGRRLSPIVLRTIIVILGLIAIWRLLA